MVKVTAAEVNKLRKTTKGKGRHFLTVKEGAGMTAALTVPALKTL